MFKLLFWFCSDKFIATMNSHWLTNMTGTAISIATTIQRGLAESRWPQVVRQVWEGISKDHRHVVDEDTVKIQQVWRAPLRLGLHVAAVGCLVG